MLCREKMWGDWSCQFTDLFTNACRRILLVNKMVCDWHTSRKTKTCSCLQYPVGYFHKWQKREQLRFNFFSAAGFCISMTAVSVVLSKNQIRCKSYRVCFLRCAYVLCQVTSVSWGVWLHVSWYGSQLREDNKLKFNATKVTWLPYLWIALNWPWEATNNNDNRVSLTTSSLYSFSCLSDVKLKGGIVYGPWLHNMGGGRCSQNEFLWEGFVPTMLRSNCQWLPFDFPVEFFHAYSKLMSMSDRNARFR